MSSVGMTEHPGPGWDADPSTTHGGVDDALDHGSPGHLGNAELIVMLQLVLGEDAMTDPLRSLMLPSRW